MKYRIDPYLERLQAGERYPLFHAYRDHGKAVTIEGSALGWHWVVSFSKP